MEKEEWRKIGSQFNYEVSNLGRVRNIKSPFGRVGFRIKILKQFFTKYDYKIVSICYDRNGNKKQTTWLVHRLVANAFIENPLNKKTVNHKNGIKTYNHMDNLEWCTQGENNAHSFRIGIRNNRGENHPQARLCENDILNIRNEAKSSSRSKIATKYGVSKSMINAIVWRDSWSFVK